LTRVPVHVPIQAIHTTEARMSEAFTVTHTSTNTCNSVAIKNLVKIVKYPEYLKRVHSTIASKVILAVAIKIVSYLYYVLSK